MNSSEFSSRAPAPTSTFETDADSAVCARFSTIADALGAGETVATAGFGTLSAKSRPAGTFATRSPSCMAEVAGNPSYVTSSAALPSDSTVLLRFPPSIRSRSSFVSAAGLRIVPSRFGIWPGFRSSQRFGVRSQIVAVKHSLLSEKSCFSGKHHMEERLVVRSPDRCAKVKMGET